MNHQERDTLNKKLIEAASSGNLKAVQAALAAGADVHARGDGALRWSADSGHLPVVQVLLAAGADVHADSDYALRLAAGNGHLQVVEYLNAHIAREQAEPHMSGLPEMLM